MENPQMSPKWTACRQEAQAEIARRARQAGEETFAREIEAGCWDETNRRDIKFVMYQLAGDRGLL